MKNKNSDILFEWDDNKERLNIKKHGISISVAARVFLDNERIEIYEKSTASMRTDIML